MSTSRPNEHLTIGYPSHSATASTRSGSPSSTSPSDPSPGGAIRPPFGLPPGLAPPGKMAGTSRSGTGSPSHEMAATGRLYSKRYDTHSARCPRRPANPCSSTQSSRDSSPGRRSWVAGPSLGRPPYQWQLYTSAGKHSRVANRWLSRLHDAPYSGESSPDTPCPRGYGALALLSRRCGQWSARHTFDPGSQDVPPFPVAESLPDAAAWAGRLRG